MGFPPNRLAASGMNGQLNRLSYSNFGAHRSGEEDCVLVAEDKIVLSCLRRGERCSLHQQLRSDLAMKSLPSKRLSAANAAREIGAIRVNSIKPALAGSALTLKL
jgi:hypothetical protein